VLPSEHRTLQTTFALIACLASPALAATSPTPRGVALPQHWIAFGPLKPTRSAAAGGLEEMASRLSADALRTLPTQLATQGQELRGRRIALVGNRIDLAEHFGGVQPGKGVYLFAEVSAARDTEIKVGAGADWYMRWWVDGKRVYDTVASGNKAFPIGISNHVFKIPLAAGKHVLAVCVISGRNSFVFAAGDARDLAHVQSTYRAAYEAGTKKLRTFPHASGHMTATVDLAGARAEFEKALRSAQSIGEQAAARLAIATTLIHDLDATDYGAIRKEYGEVLALEPIRAWKRRSYDRIEAQLGVAHTYLREKDYPLARKSIADARTISQHPCFQGAIALARARLHIQQRQLPAARQELERLMQMSGLHREQLTKQQAQQTIQAIIVANRLRPDHPRLFLNADSWPAVKARALGPERDLFEKLKQETDAIPANEITRGDWGLHLMRTAFVYRVTEDQALFGKIKTMLHATVDHYLTRKVYNSRSYPRVGWLAALDWVWNDLTPPERRNLATRMVKYVYSLYVEDKLRNRLAHQPWYYARNVWWYAGLVLLDDELDDVDYARVLAVLAQGYSHNRSLMNEYRERGGDDGAWHLNLEYSLCELPTILWAFMHTWQSALGAEIPHEWLNVGLPVDYVLRNVVDVKPSAQGLRHFGYSRSWGRGRARHDLLYDHLGHFVHFFGLSHPEHAGVARHVRERIENVTGPARGQYPVFPFLLTNLDQALPARVPASMPTARHFENVGLVLMSSGWGEADTYALFAAGGGTLPSEHYDATHFTIYKKGHLALDSGARGAGAHSANYWSQTVAHNCVLIRRPGDDAPLPARSGGQIRTTAAAKVLAFETRAGYSYAASDATATYDPKKCSQMVRQMVFLPPDHFVVFDRVAATESGYAKRWLLHTANEPALAGKTSHADSGEGRIFCRTLYPPDAALVKIGGPGQEFMAGGTNWPLPKNWLYWRQVNHRIPETMGRWRVEVSPGALRQQDCFLHLIQVSDQSRQDLSPANVTESASQVHLTFTERGRTYQLSFNRLAEIGGHIRITEGHGVTDDRDLTQAVMPQQGLALTNTQPKTTGRSDDPFAAALEREPSGAHTLIGPSADHSVDALLADLKGPDWALRRRTAWALGTQEASRAVTPLMAALSDTDWRVRRYAAWALSQIGAPAASSLAAALRDGDATLQAHAAAALAAMGEPAVDPLLAAFEDRRGPVRGLAAEALGKIGDRRALARLTVLLADSDPFVRSHAAHALGRLQDASALEPLMGALRDSDTTVRSSAAQGLGEMKAPRAVQPLIAALSDQDASVRRFAAVALGQIRDPQAVEPLIHAMADPSRTVGLEAHASLVTVTGHKMHIGLDWSAETIRQYRQPKWRQWWARTKTTVEK